MPPVSRAASRAPSVARQILLWQVVVVCVLVLGGVALAWFDARADATSSARQRALDLAVAVADTPTVRDAVRTSDPTTVLQPFAEQVRRDSGTDFVVVMSRDGIRYSHPDVDVIGERFIGSIEEAQAGRTHTE
ncbi:MAG: histidine kinase, partial [Actinomycetales bacterium]